MRQILISSKFFTRSQKFVKTMSSKKQKHNILKRKNTCKRNIQPHCSHPGLQNEAEARSRTGSHCLLRPKQKNQDHRAGVGNFPGTQGDDATQAGGGNLLQIEICPKVRQNSENLKPEFEIFFGQKICQIEVRFAKFLVLSI